MAPALLLSLSLARYPIFLPCLQPCTRLANPILSSGSASRGSRKTGTAPRRARNNWNALLAAAGANSQRGGERREWEDRRAIRPGSRWDPSTHFGGAIMVVGRFFFLSLIPIRFPCAFPLPLRVPWSFSAGRGNGWTERRRPSGRARPPAWTRSIDPDARVASDQMGATRRPRAGCSCARATQDPSGFRFVLAQKRAWLSRRSLK
jgi:hypothetical protein